MTQQHRTTVIASLILIATAATSRQVDGADVEVQLLDGHSTVGQVADRTNSDRLWLSRPVGSTIVLTSVQWTSIRTIEMDGRQVTSRQLRESLEDARAPRSIVAPAVRQLPEKIAGFKSYADFARQSLGL